MRLRNKRTGEIIEADSGYSDGLIALSYVKGNVHIDDSFSSLAELNDEWEDYTPQEPLIKDEKIRKAVRAWAEANDIKEASAYLSSHYWYLRAFNENEAGIDFWGWKMPIPLIENHRYTIAELCGEEE